MAECGTPAGYEAHWRNDEPACDECRQAHAERSRRYRARRSPATRERHNARQKARRDALEQLAYEYPERFAELLAEMKSAQRPATASLPNRKD